MSIQENKEFFFFIWFVRKLIKAGDCMIKAVKCTEKHLRWGPCYSTGHRCRRLPVNFTHLFRAAINLCPKLE